MNIYYSVNFKPNNAQIDIYFLFFSFKTDYEAYLNEESDENLKHAKESGMIFRNSYLILSLQGLRWNTKRLISYIFYPERNLKPWPSQY